VPFGIFDMSGLAGLDGIEGFLSLGYFSLHPVTFDYPAGVIVMEKQKSGDISVAGAPSIRQTAPLGRHRVRAADTPDEARTRSLSCRHWLLRGLGRVRVPAG
jgi:hypothetical protein